MARLESTAVGGYFKTPTHLLPRISKLIEPTFYHKAAIMDPCVGDGEALITLAKSWVKGSSLSLYTCEMEATRSEAYKKRCKAAELSDQYHLYGDAFKVSLKRCTYTGMGALYLNPPYDTDKVHGRLEQKFLHRFTPALVNEGILLFVVPYYALRASADYLATEYKDLHCFKFPDEDFQVYKQVILFGVKTETRMAPSSKLKRQVLTWAEGSALKELPNITSDPIGTLPEVSNSWRSAMDRWEVQKVDTAMLALKAKPWHHNTRGGSLVPIHGILPEVPIEDLLLRKYPVATPPRPAHIAAGIASGIFNGAKIKPIDQNSNLPELLIKGAFDQEWRTVEEKVNKKGETTGIVQIQQPKLVVTILDLSTHKYHTLPHEGNGFEIPQLSLPDIVSASKYDISKMTITDLMKHYGDSLMEVMEQQCPILYDPRKDGDSVHLAPTKRALYTAQQHAAKALVRLLGGPDLPIYKRRGKGAILLGEIGCGKTGVSTTVAHTLQAKRPLVLCPPHLLTSWKNEVAAVLPGVEFRTIESVTDLQELAADTRPEPIFSVMSREVAKLDHGWEGVGATCPKCGAPTPKGNLAKKRSRCEAETLTGFGPVYSLVLKLSRQLIKYSPDDTTLRRLLTGRLDLLRIQKAEKVKEEDRPLFPGFSKDYFTSVVDPLIDLAEDPKVSIGKKDQARKALVWVLAHCEESVIVQAAERMSSSEDYYIKQLSSEAVLLLPPNCSAQKEYIRTHPYPNQSYYNSWRQVEDQIHNLQKGVDYLRIQEIRMQWVNGSLLFLSQEKVGSLGAASAVLQALAYTANFKREKPCEEFLYQAASSPRRIALAKYIHRYHKGLFDFLILDEAHEYSTSMNSAQAISAHRLTGLGIPTIEMTGSIMNGYAESLFMIMWSISEDFRREFNRDDKARFIDRYGYRKRLVQEKDVEGQVVEFGSMSDRVTRSERNIGNAPGVLPLFLLRHLLPVSVTLHKDDLALDLPKCTQERHLIEPNKELAERYQKLQRVLLERIKKDRFKKDLAGKLFGQLAELPSYLDRATADTGNTDQGDYEIRYPDSVGGEVLESQTPFNADVIMPKEEWLLDRVEQELEEGRNVMVFSWHVTVMPRLQRLLHERLGEKVPILYANKVATAKRQNWITKQVVSKGARVMLTNPVAIQTGLNNLVHFATEIWMENPACNPIIFRQAIGRVDRIGQKVPTRILCPIYANTIQEAAYDLLLKKVAVSISTDGLDPESAMLAAGIGTDEFLTGLSIGKQLWVMLSEVA